MRGIMGRYRYDIGLNKYPYGTEVEFINASLQQLEQEFKKTTIPIALVFDHKGSDTIYNKNYLDTDGTVSSQIGNEIVGGEVSTRLYQNKEIDWMEIEEICNQLIENGASVNERCSNQININLTPITKKVLFMETLSKVIAVYEGEMEDFYMGDRYGQRKERYTYARPIRVDLIRKVNKIDFRENKDYLYDLLYRNRATFVRRDGISLQDYRINGRMEIRYPNGTLNKKTIQNNINFSLKLVDAKEEEKFDLERLTREINQELEMNQYWYDYRSEEEHYKRLESLVTTMATSSEDTNDFMTQYEKVLSTKPKR